MSKTICTECGSRDTKSHTRGSFLVEVALWLCFLLPGLIYSLWRISTRGQVCKACGSDKLVPANSPKGLRLAKELA